MLLEQFYLGCLAHASYLVASNGEAIVIDPQRDVDLYLETAASKGWRIRYIIETHLHADFVSGHRELAERTGAEICLGARAEAKFLHRAIRDGDKLPFGQCEILFLETPGHTIESVCAVLTDRETSPHPAAVFTGDTLFVGDVGRPDLSGDYTPQQLAGMLYDSLHQKLLRLPAEVQVYPAHGAGSLCGRQMSQERSSTIGRERESNYALRARSKEEFVELLTAELPPRPEYFRREVELNRQGAASLDGLPPLAAFDGATVLEIQKGGALILDTRPVMEYAVAHIPGSIHIGLSGQFASWAARLLGLDEKIVLLAEDDIHLEETRRRLARVGIEGVVGYLLDGIGPWIRKGLPVEFLPQVSVDEVAEWLRERPSEVTVLDVREPSEWESGTIPGALRISLGHLSAKIPELDKSRYLFVNCKGGYRSSIAASLLRRAGFEKAVNVTGGFDAWKAANFAG